MGKAIILSNCDFSSNNIGRVTFTQDIPLISLGILGPTTVVGSINVTTYNPIYNPVNTSQRGVIWTIEDGEEYASITTDGKLSILSGADEDNVTIKVTSIIDSSISATQNIVVTYDGSLVTNTITVTATATSLTATATTAVTSNVTITFTGGLSTTLTINSGSTSATKSISSASSSRTCNLSIAPSSDSTYNYVLSSSTVTIPAGVSTNTITVTATEDSITATATTAVTSNITISFTGDLSDSLSISYGSTTATKSIATSSSSRTCNLSVSPSSDVTYNYVLSSSTVTIPAVVIPANLQIVGPSEVTGDVRAGNYFILNTSSMKQVVGSQAEVTDDYKEYIGPISWSVTSGSTYASFASGSATEGLLNVNSGASTSSATISATAGTSNATKNITATYDETDLVINNLSDLQAFADAINNQTESSLITGATNGGGFAGNHIRLGNDIDMNNTGINIGVCAAASASSSNRYFAGWFDGAGYRIYNIGNTISTSNWSSPLFQATKGGSKLSNFIMEGTVVIPTASNKKGGSLVGLAFSGITTIEKVYNKCNISGGASNQYAVIFGGTSAESGVTGTFNFIDTVFAGTLNAQYNNGANAGGVGNKVYRNTVIGTMTASTVGSGSSGSKIWSTSSDTATGDPATFKDNICNTNYQGSNYICLVHNGQGSGSIKMENTIMAGKINASTSNKYIWYSTTGQSSNVYYESSLELSSQTGVTSKTKSELQSGSVFSSNDNWIQVENYYPIINNQYAVDAAILERAKNGVE